MFGKPRTTKSKSGLLATSLFVLCAWALIPADTGAEIATLDEFKALGEDFDHLTTGFALTGGHTVLNCGECHIGGVFEALPRQCEACHDNVIAEGMPSGHVETSQPCDTCHTTEAFIASAVMDHSLVNGACSSCHNGVSGTGKSASHISTTNICDACHTTNFWSPVVSSRVDHAHTLGDCVSCHNGVNATGKSAGHIPSTDTCDGCHLATSGPDWPVNDSDVDHGHVLGTCSVCHADDKPADHIPTQKECNSCHQTPTTGATSWLPVIEFNHDNVQGQSCVLAGCHDTDKPADMLHTNVTNVCGACHSAGGGWTPALQVDHGEVLGRCSGCHDGTVATGKGPDHVPTTEECSACHTPGDPTWAANTTEN